MPAKRILVTGGTGFVGRHLVRALVARGDAVTVLSRDAGASGARGLPAEVRVVAYTPLAEGPWCDEIGTAAMTTASSHVSAIDAAATRSSWVSVTGSPKPSA